MTKALTIADILAMEPHLKEIADIAALEAKTAWNPWPVYGKAKAAADSLVGWGAENKDLKTCAAYECYIDYLVDRMGL